PGINVTLPGGASRNAKLRSFEAAPTERNAAIDRQKFTDSFAIGANHLLRVGVTTHVLHEFDDLRQTRPPETGLFHRRRRHVFDSALGARSIAGVIQHYGGPDPIGNFPRYPTHVPSLRL